jgi:hypothetical protein
MGKMTAENNNPTNTKTTLRARARFTMPSFFKTEWEWTPLTSVCGKE